MAFLVKKVRIVVIPVLCLFSSRFYLVLQNDIKGMATPGKCIALVSVWTNRVMLQRTKLERYARRTESSDSEQDFKSHG